jgi:threonine/homoserine/homoserine lactone efflux protein
MDTLLPLLAFAFVLSITPGPNVLMLAAAAAGHGLRATWPHNLGIALGFGAMLAVVCAGVGLPLQANPWLHGALRWVGAAWLLWIAWKIATAPPPDTAGARPPLGFWGAVAFQWVNPKAWMICGAASAAYVRPDAPLVPQVLLVSGAFIAMALPSNLAWAAFGAAMGRWLRKPRRLRVFNIGMALLLVLSLLPLL